ncbi:hypothetical protein ACK8GG_14770 [Micromonosporaceae bacterium DT55]|uniref:hypothetical protein n=1 Tax=Melissospora conviva TaxID=3388432 RepID=UPI003C1DAA0B
MGDRNQLHDLRNQAHKAGVEGSSKMSESQLKRAMRDMDKGMKPMMAKQDARSRK